MNNKIKIVAIITTGVLAGVVVATKVVKIVKTHKQEKESK